MTSVDVDPPWVENRPRNHARSLRLQELWDARELLFFLALRDVKSRYKQAFFGVGWAILQPVAGAAILVFVFQRLAGVSSAYAPYPVFALIGFSIWTYFSSTLAGEIESLVGNASLVTKVYFPRLVAPLAALLPNLIGLALSLGLVVVAMAGFGLAPRVNLLSLPLCVLSLVVAALGPGLLLATLNVRYRDVGSLFAPLIQLWFFASPVAYPVSLISGRWQWVYAVNPLVGVLEGFRWAFTGSPLDGVQIAISAATTFILLAGGMWYFAIGEREFADLI